MIKYTYDFVSKTPNLSSIFLISRIEREPDPKTAEMTFAEAIKDYSAGLETKNNRMVLKGNLKSWCDNSFASFIIDDSSDDVHGCILVFQKNNLVYSIITSGILFEDKEEIGDLLFPLLESAERWSSTSH